MFKNLAIMMALIAVFASNVIASEAKQSVIASEAKQSVNSQETVPGQIAIGEKLRKESKYQEALEAFLKAYQIELNNSEVIWRIARAYVDLGNMEESKEKKKPLYLKAEKYARKGVKIDPNSSYCHTYLAIVLGKIAIFEGGKNKVRFSKEIKEEAMKAVELDPKNDIAYHILGRWHREVANSNRFLKTFAKALYGGLPKASNEESAEYFKKAIEVNPTSIIHRLELAKTYQKMKKWKLALGVIDAIDQLPQSYYSDQEYKKEAKRIRAEIEKKLK